MNQISNRIRIDGAAIYVASYKKAFLLFFLPIWLIGWTIGGIAVFSSVISGKANEAIFFMLLWLCLWLLGELFALYAFLWNAFGFEIISVQSGILTIKKSIFGYGPIKQYHTSNISNLRASGFFGSMMSWTGNMAYWGLTGGTVAFDYKNKTYHFGISLQEKEAKQVVENMKNLFF